MNFIDANVHVWTADTSHYPLAPGDKAENVVPRSFTPEERLRALTVCSPLRFK
jgi:hypothetical protein